MAGLTGVHWAVLGADSAIRDVFVPRYVGGRGKQRPYGDVHGVAGTHLTLGADLLETEPSMHQEFAN